jgi:hypothetical protein
MYAESDEKGRMKLYALEMRLLKWGRRKVETY